MYSHAHSEGQNYQNHADDATAKYFSENVDGQYGQGRIQLRAGAARPKNGVFIRCACLLIICSEHLDCQYGQERIQEGFNCELELHNPRTVFSFVALVS